MGRIVIRASEQSVVKHSSGTPAILSVFALSTLTPTASPDALETASMISSVIPQQLILLEGVPKIHIDQTLPSNTNCLR